jgi:hypothetical protein
MTDEIRICPVCGRKFTPADRVQPTAAAGSEVQVEYCSMTCKRKRNNKLHYLRHKDERIERTKRDREKRRESA